MQFVILLCYPKKEMKKLAKVRQDAWSHEDDLLLAETVLRHVREGSTQLNAFEEVGDELNRTSAACGFRWNAEVRQKYDHAIDLAKKQRKEKKRAMAMGKAVTSQKTSLTLPQLQDDDEPSEHPVPVAETAPERETVTERETITAEETVSEPTMTMDTVIQYLKKVKKDYEASNQSKHSIDAMNQDNTKLRNQVQELQSKLTQTEEQLANIQEDYQVFMQIMDRARKMTVFEDQGNIKPPAFRMDKNGNLQQLAPGSE